jgi:hypothetical protein
MYTQVQSSLLLILYWQIKCVHASLCLQNCVDEVLRSELLVGRTSAATSSLSSLHCFLSFKFSSTSRRTSFSRFSTYACTRTSTCGIRMCRAFISRCTDCALFSSEKSVIFQLKGVLRSWSNV